MKRRTANGARLSARAPEAKGRWMQKPLITKKRGTPQEAEEQIRDHLLDGFDPGFVDSSAPDRGRVDATKEALRLKHENEQGRETAQQVYADQSPTLGATHPFTHSPIRLVHSSRRSVSDIQDKSWTRSSILAP